jgi:hypothetical protein
MQSTVSSSDAICLEICTNNSQSVLLLEICQKLTCWNSLGTSTDITVVSDVPTTSISAGKASRASDRVPIDIARRGSASAEASKSPYSGDNSIQYNVIIDENE